MFLMTGCKQNCAARRGTTHESTCDSQGLRVTYKQHTISLCIDHTFFLFLILRQGLIAQAGLELALQLGMALNSAPASASRLLISAVMPGLCFKYQGVYLLLL